ncbi:protein FAR1-RELATED SEQUENCE 5-like [Chenopodium quinoa]|uniref:protein FAR1-RELATED SEQUENCE 5-like n=1 Tax=Chenopodium quinoa TaxID=63459 RepID=UPI000B779BAB|nr:protein FAR1-RELATED SEQUENCE 5-like [Chenopodium quinoa]
MTEELQNFPESQESMEIEQIDLSGSTLTDDARYTEQHDIDYTGSLVGFTAATLEEIFEEYKKHAFVIGFGVRQSTTRYTQTEPKKVRGKDFVCSKEGFRVKPKNQKTPTPIPGQKQKKKRQVPITRTGCKAFIRAKKNKEGMFEVEEHVMQHNHELTRREWQHLQRSERKITEDKAKVIDIMAESGLRPAESYCLMAYEAGGENVLAHTMKDHFNYITRKKIMEIEGGDAQTGIDILNQRQ